MESSAGMKSPSISVEYTTQEKEKFSVEETYSAIHAERKPKACSLSRYHMVSLRVVLCFVHVCPFLGMNMQVAVLQHQNIYMWHTTDVVKQTLLKKHMVALPEPNVKHRQLAVSPPGTKFSALAPAGCSCFM